MKKDLDNLERTREVKRKRRAKTGAPVVALVGYTGAGKSTLLRSLTGAGVLVEDRLFSTLDPTTRKLDLPQGSSVLLTDTVGFVRKLPHELVEAFRSTLEEVSQASLLIHVVGASRDPERQIAAVAVLNEIGATEKPTLIVLNKVDLVMEVEIDKLQGRYPGAVLTAASDKQGLDELLDALSDHLAQLRVEVSLNVPFDRGDLVARVHEEGEVLQETYGAHGTHLVADRAPGTERVPRFVEPAIEEVTDGDEFVLDPPLTEALVDRLARIWIDVTRAGGAVGGAPTATAADLEPVIEDALSRVRSGTDHMVAATKGAM